MSRAQVRKAVFDYISPLPGLTLYTSQPKMLNGQDFNLSLNNGSGAAGFVFIKEERERRIAMGGATSGWKQVDFDIALIVRFRSVKPNSEEAMDDYDNLLDSLKALIRADHTLGNSDIIFQAGESGLGLTIASDLPVEVNGETHVWSAVEFTVVQMVQA